MQATEIGPDPHQLVAVMLILLEVLDAAGPADVPEGSDEHEDAKCYNEYTYC